VRVWCGILSIQCFDTRRKISLPTMQQALKLPKGQLYKLTISLQAVHGHKEAWLHLQRTKALEQHLRKAMHSAFRRRLEHNVREAKRTELDCTHHK
jgi:hypothetical protein